MKVERAWLLLFLLPLFGCTDPGSNPVRPQGQLDWPRAGETAVWTGSGNITVTEDTVEDGACQGVQLIMRVRADSLHLESLDMQCDLFWTHYATYDAEIRGNEIWLAQERVGTIDESAITVDVSRAPVWTEHFEFRLESATSGSLYHRRTEGGSVHRTLEHRATLTTSG
jgi:hypothetical protein